MSSTRPYYIAGRWERSDDRLEVVNPYDGSVVGVTSYVSEAHIEEALSAAERAFAETRRLPAYARSEVLLRIRDGMLARCEELARLIVQEAGKPWRDASGEVERAALTVQTAAEEARRIGGEMIPLDWAPRGRQRVGVLGRFPIGPVLGISPFNFPLNLAIHKLGPAIAAGNPIILKPASKTPLVMLAMAEIIDGAGLPAGAVSILPLPGARAERLAGDSRIKAVSFTGSSQVGWRLRDVAGPKRVLLELGGNAGVIVDESAPLDYAVGQLVVGGFAYDGQSCISVQRIYVHGSIFDNFLERFGERVANLKVGDPMDPNTDLGPMIDEDAARRIAAWVEEAVVQGARVVTGGHRRGSVFEPTVLVGAPPEAKVCAEEAFAPLVVVSPFDTFEEAVREVNRSYYGLQAGVFTRDLERAWYAFENIEVGGVVINDVATWRAEHQPYGGVKGSGLGREGVKYAIEEMTDLRLMILNRSWTQEGP